MTVRFRRVAVTQGVWMVSALGVLLALGRFGLETFFVLAFLGLLATMVLYAPTGDPPAWWRPLVMVSVLCFVAFAYVIYLRFAAIA